MSDDRTRAFLRGEKERFEGWLRERRMCVRGAFDSIVGAMATRGDEAPPVPQGDYEYFSRAVEGREGTVLMRQRLDGTGEAEVILDADALFPRAAPSVADVKVSG